MEAILEHYSESVEYRSPLIRGLAEEASGFLQGKEKLRAYFEKGLAAYPDLNFKLQAVCSGVDSLVLLYESVRDLQAAELLVLDASGKIREVRAHYRGL